MGRSFHILDGLPWPFMLVDERMISVPAKAALVTRNQDFKLIAFLEGCFRMEIDKVGQFEVRPGDFVVIPRPCVQNYFPAKPSQESRLHVFRLIFDPSLAGLDQPESGLNHSPLVGQLQRVFPSVRYFSGGLKGELGIFLNQILKEIDTEAMGYRDAVHGLLLQLTANLLRLEHETSGPNAEKVIVRADQIVSQALAYLTDNFDRPIKLADVAWHLRISEEHLARVFHQRTGETVLHAIRKLRIAKASRLLLGTNESLSTIAKSCGFGSLAVFSVNFKALTGLGPGAYRRTHSAKIIFSKSSLEWETQSNADKT